MPAERELDITRWAKQGITSRLMSSAMQKSRPSINARAWAERNKAKRPAGADAELETLRPPRRVDDLQQVIDQCLVHPHRRHARLQLKTSACDITGLSLSIGFDAAGRAVSAVRPRGSDSPYAAAA